MLIRKRARRLLQAALGAVVLTALLGGGRPAHAQISELPYADTTAGTFFGGAVAIDGDVAVVGASGESREGENAGAAYVFERDPATDRWRQAARLVPLDAKAGLFFGRSVAISGDRVLVAASGEFFSLETPNAAYVFERDRETGAWEQAAKLTPLRTSGAAAAEEGAFAASVSLDGDRALVTTWGDALKGTYGGAAYLFERDAKSGHWEQAARLEGSGPLREGIFGGAGALDGDRLAVAASTYFRRKPGSVYLFERDPATDVWRETERIGGIDDFYIALDLDGDRLLVGESKADGESGLAALYEREASGAWRRVQKLRPSSPYEHGGFGSAVALGGDHALVAGYDEQLGLTFNIDRVVYVFGYKPARGAWRQGQVLDVGEVAFGSAIDHDGRFAVIGQASDTHAGKAYVVRLR